MTVKELFKKLSIYVDDMDNSKVYIYDGVSKVELESDMVHYSIDESGNESIELHTY